MDRIERLIAEFKHDLEQALDSLRQTMEQGFSRINDRLDDQAEHLDRVADSIECAVLRLRR